MRKPNHIVLDFEQNSSLNSNFYWASSLLSLKKTPLFLNYTNVSRKYESHDSLKNSSKFISTLKENTLKPNNFHKANLLKDWEKRGLLSIYNSDKSEFQSTNHDMFDYLNLSSHAYKKKTLNMLQKKFSVHNTKSNFNLKLTHSLDTINVNFLRKERLYTKLKYSRSPAYDIVSGGAAALLAGFIGFLISEKFGYELVDSGDFYYAFMYGVFMVFSLKPLLTVSDSQKGFVQCLSLKPLLSFYASILKLSLKKLT